MAKIQPDNDTPRWPAGSLFGSPDTKTGDPSTSREAGRRSLECGAKARNMEIVVGLVRRYPGSTSKELSMKTKAINRHEIARRLPDAEAAGLIARGLMRSCSVGRGNAVTWHLPEWGSK